jgi:hypothetical protein
MIPFESVALLTDDFPIDIVRALDYCTILFLTLAPRSRIALQQSSSLEIHITSRTKSRF